MNIKYLEYFVTLAQTLNFTHAASVLHITQPAFSRHISSLEEEIGLKLFERNKRTVRLTAAGKALLPETERVLQNYNWGIHKAKRAKEGFTQSIKIGFQNDARNQKFAEFAVYFAEKYPDIELILQEYPFFEMYAALRNDEVDLIIGNAQGYLSEEFDYYEFDKHNYCVVLHEKHPLADREIIYPHEIADEPFIVLMHHIVLSSSIHMLTSLCERLGVVPRIVGRSKVLPSLLFKVACNQGISILTDASKGFAPPEVKFIRLGDTAPYIQSIIWKKYNQNQIRVFLDEFRSYYQDVNFKGKPIPVNSACL
jgi:DNA-binding transcriptional LysR family regulator